MVDVEEIPALVERAVQGDEAAFERLARRYFRAVYAVALAQVGRPADAEDVAQEALIRAFVRIETCKEPARFGGWLLQIARNLAKNYRKQRGRQPLLAGGPQLAETPDKNNDAMRADTRMALLDALSRLSPLQAEVVLLHDLEGWTHPEIASALEISVALSRWNLFVSRRMLRSCLRDEP